MASTVPNLQPNCPIIEVQGFGEKVDAHCRLRHGRGGMETMAAMKSLHGPQPRTHLVRLLKRPIHERFDHRSLASALVAKKNDLVFCERRCLWEPGRKTEVRCGWGDTNSKPLVQGSRRTSKSLLRVRVLGRKPCPAVGEKPTGLARLHTETSAGRSIDSRAQQ